MSRYAVLLLVLTTGWLLTGLIPVQISQAIVNNTAEFVEISMAANEVVPIYLFWIGLSGFILLSICLAVYKLGKWLIGT